MIEHGKFDLEQASPLILLMALFGIPAAGWVALVFDREIPRSLYGRASFLLAVETASLISVLVLLILLRICLALPSAPRGFYRDVLDFLAVARWHPATKAALIGLIVLPTAWYIHTSHWLVTMVRTMGPRALKSGEVQDGLDTIAVVWQLTLTGGVPLLFALHMLSRWKRTNHLLPWLMVPLLFAGTAIAVVLIVAAVH